MSDLGKKTVLYSSLYSHGVDAKRRLSIPAKWRNPDASGEETLTLLIWKKSAQHEACLMALSDELMGELLAKLRGMSLSDPKAESLRRLLGGGSDQVTVDKAGRICLPEPLAKAAGITDTAVMIGLLDSFQVWNPERLKNAAATDESLRDVAYSML